MDSTCRLYYLSCNYITNMKHACLFLFEKFENLTGLNAVYVRGDYRGPRTIGFIIRPQNLEDCFEVITWFRDQFKSKRHSFYRYTIDVEEGDDRLSIFIEPPRILKEILFEGSGTQAPLAVFLNALNNLNFDYLQMKIEEEVKRRKDKYSANKNK